MVKRRVLAISDSTMFICQLPEETQKIIRADLEECAREQEEDLLIDEESGDYMGLSRRFCDISHIYQHTELLYCKSGEEQIAYEESKERNITLTLEEGYMEELCNAAGKIGLLPSELLEEMTGSLIRSIGAGRSHKEPAAAEWYEEKYAEMLSKNKTGRFLSYLLQRGKLQEEVNEVETLEEMKEILSIPRKERTSTEQAVLSGWIWSFWDCFQRNREQFDPEKKLKFKNEWERVKQWLEEREIMREGNYKRTKIQELQKIE